MILSLSMLHVQRNMCLILADLHYSDITGGQGLLYHHIKYGESADSAAQSAMIWDENQTFPDCYVEDYLCEHCVSESRDTR